LATDQNATAQTTFGNVTLGGGGYVTGIIGCPGQQNLFYAKTDVGGAYRWDEATQSWIPLLDWNSQNQTTYQGVESFAIDPQDPSKLYILAGTSYWNSGNTAILRSTNYGNTFAITDVTSKFKANGNGADRQKGESLAVDPNLGSILFCGTRANGLFKSTDSGVTWNSVSSLNVGTSSISFVLFDPQTGTPGSATQRIFVGVFRTGSANFYVSNDGGATWTAVAGSPTASMPERCALASNNYLYLTYGVDPNGALMKYNVTNGTWLNCSPSGTKTYCGISVCATNPNKLIATTYSEWLQQPWGWGDRIFVSTNGGTNWTDIIANGQVTMNANGFPYIVNNAIHWAGALVMDPFNSDRVFVGSGNGIFSTSNLNSGLTTSTWKFTVKGLEETVPIDFLSVPGGPLLNSVGDQGGFVHTDITVSPTIKMSQARDFAYASQKPNFVVTVLTSSNCYYSTAPFTTWTQFPAAPNGMTDGNVAVSADGSTVLWRSTASSTNACYVNTNPATSWVPSSGLTFSASPAGDPLNSSKFYAYNSSDGYVYSSTNTGFNFYRAGKPGTGGGAMRVAPGFEGHVWVPLGGGGVKYSTNSGVTFWSGNLYDCDAVTFGKTAPGTSYPAIFIWGMPTSSSTPGMYRSNDQGATWVRVNDDAHQYGGRGNAGLIVGDMNVHGRVYMSTAGRGVVYMSSSVPVTGIAVAPASVFTYPTATQPLSAALSPTNATYTSVTWASADTNVASVSASGLLTANSAGTTTITATALDGGFTAGCNVTVTNLPPVMLTSEHTSDNSSLTLSWPIAYTGWLLQVQTNAPDAGLGTNWFAIPGSVATNQILVPIDATSGSVFYRLISP
jgi:hypothetical protein